MGRICAAPKAASFLRGRRGSSALCRPPQRSDFGEVEEDEQAASTECDRVDCHNSSAFAQRERMSAPRGTQQVAQIITRLRPSGRRGAPTGRLNAGRAGREGRRDARCAGRIGDREDQQRVDDRRRARPSVETTWPLHSSRSRVGPGVRAGRRMVRVVSRPRRYPIRRGSTAVRPAVVRRSITEEQLVHRHRHCADDDEPGEREGPSASPIRPRSRGSRAFVGGGHLLHRRAEKASVIATFSEP